MSSLLPHSLLLLCTLLLASFQLQAATPQQDFEQGVRYFKSGKPEQAIGYFERARKAGLNTAALHYNLGVSYYKLARYESAITAFKRAGRFSKMAPLAWYNIGLVRQKQGNSKDALKWFKKASKATNDKKLKQLADRKISQLKARKKTWSGLVYGGYGYDDNVTLDPDNLNLATDQSDNFYELFVYARGQISGSRQSGWLFKGRLFDDIYTTLDQFNFMEANAGFFRTLPLGSWNSESGVYFTYSTLGDKGYLQTANLSFDARKRYARKSSLRFRVRLHALDNIEPIYNSVAGSSVDARIETRWRAGRKSRYRAYYQFDYNARNNRYNAATNEFYSLSPLRHRLRLDYDVKFSSKWRAKIAGEYRYSWYRQENNNRYTNNTDERRTENRLRAYLTLSYQFIDNMAVNLEYLYTNNFSNIQLYEYSRNIYMANVEYQF